MTNLFRTFLACVTVVVGLIGLQPAYAAEPSGLDQDARAALKSLYSGSPGAKALADKAKGILVFPNVHKAGFVVGAQTGDGVLLVNGMSSAYYNTSAVSIGLQAGAQSFGYVLFFMSDKVLTDFRNSKNFQIGMGPNIVFIDAGAAKDINNLTSKADVYAVIFSQKGLMAGVGLQGSKITKLGQ
ncbi:lipid-binding SYLF domain-containing protein [uncultured Piscinibacter sp.]|uniref:lipid-binding SYLF domain-containing protein n=1 Tax=uncultured Piscinibacter sp. TaxID=1131835 RepID=UPI00260A7F70|nr:lipid-binding SYLF domain-containing protein [uncultured Piscinibacter sp.]